MVDISKLRAGHLVAVACGGVLKIHKIEPAYYNSTHRFISFSGTLFTVAGKSTESPASLFYNPQGIVVLNHHREATDHAFNIVAILFQMMYTETLKQHMLPIKL